MKTCPVCALDLEDSYLFCPDDGSSLGTLPSGSSESGSVSASESDHETAGAVVLYCPACAAEYPLTFSACPVHGVQLTKHRIRANAPFGSLAAVPVGAFASGATAFGYQGPLTDAQERGFERPRFRVAAIATIIALAVFGLVAMYTFVSRVSRRSSSPAVRVASKTEAAPQPLPFVPTPQEAQDYKEEAPAPAASTPPESQPERPVERARNESPLSSPTEHGVRKTTVGQLLPKPPAKPTLPTPVTTTRVSNPPMPALPRGNSGGFDARLIRVRSRKTAAGFRYDLTFNMQEQAGRSAQWQRVLINTRSASGVNHSEAIPFSHRLGAAGALTFTISVELTGRSESDWQGRIVCTTLGWDNNGAPLQASFGANVTP
jgi:hypothetical protein